ncbi:kinase [Alicyclobacillus sp. SO9]|uniref:kinase n=1 Tax=Alicyclobacillus sp. SO9 TaxID=2665646 RepID=UPI0018E8AB7B|nr:kinase [Alicyclobacillus sp. SO9]QQE77072.1 hypothetical protein GI364_13910 [Alicyclobacillus sp. SO9]
METNADKLVNAIERTYCNARLVVGVDGLSRAGKTTMVNETQKKLVEKRLPVCVFHLDHYIVESRNRYHTGFEEWYEYYELQWDVRYLRQRLFEKVQHAEEIRLPFYDVERDETVTKSVVIQSDAIVMIEGVFLQREEWRRFFDFVIYVDCPRTTRFERESPRTAVQIEKFVKRYWKAEDHYLKTVSPISTADLVVSC